MTLGAPKKKGPAQKSWPRKVLEFFILLFFFAVFFGVLLMPVGSGHYRAVPSAAMQTSRVIGLRLFEYAKDHGGHYPEGKTSTEVFQHLIDEKYITDPSVFYFNYGNRLPQKVRPPSDHLRAENVCWDTTSGVDSSAPDGVPVVFLTGYTVTYQAGAKAVPLVPLPERSWYKQWLDSGIVRSFTGAAYTSSTPTWGKSIAARVINSDEDGSIPNFIPADFDAKGKTYRQLKP